MVKVIAFPLRLGRRWAFQVLPTLKSDGSAGGAAAAKGAAATGTMAMLRELMSRLNKAPPRVSDRMLIAVKFAEEQMHNSWVQLESSKPGSIRHRVHGFGKKLLAKLEPSEHFFKSIPQDTAKINIIHPASVNPRLARRRLRHLAISGTLFHKRLFYGSLALVPFTMLFAILPLPNVVLFWNLFRAHAHWRALHGSTKLQHLVTERATGPCSWEFTPSEKLEQLVSIANASAKPLSNEKIEAICKEYQLDSVDVTKWRDHTSKYVKLAWV